MIIVTSGPILEYLIPSNANLINTFIGCMDYLAQSKEIT